MKNTLCLFALLFPILFFSQSQLGQDIDGISSYSYFGSRLAFSADGETLATGASFNDNNGTNTGLVQVYRYQNGFWSQIGQNIYGQNDLNYLGNVALSSDGNILAVGASGNFMNGGGYAQVYEFENGFWSQIGNDIPNEFVNDDSIGISLSSDGTVFAIGAPENYNNGESRGHVRVYENIANNWIQIGNDIDGENQYDDFGQRLVLSSNGDILAVGGYQNDGNGADSGHVRVFENISGTWLQLGSDIEGEAAGDLFGISLALSSNGSILAVGGSKNGGNGLDSGHVRVFEKLDGNWSQIGTDIEGDAIGDEFGSSVSLSSDGSILSVGAMRNDENGTDSGHVRIFINIGGSWVQFGNSIKGESTQDEFGITNSISSNGQILAVGGWLNDGGGNYSGHIRVYDISSLLGVDEVFTSPLKVFPIPAQDIITIIMEDPSSLTKLNLLNIEGKQIKSSFTSSINVSNLTSGTYILEVLTTKYRVHKKVIIN